MKKRLLSIVFALLMLCQLLSFSILATDVTPGENETEPKVWSYDVTWTDGDGYTIAAVEGSSSPVDEGNDFSFTVTVLDGFNGDAMVVKANGVTLTATDNVYTIENITADQTITVEGVEEEAETLKGDFSGDGKVTVTDVAMLRRFIVGLVDSLDGVTDFSGDGKTTVTDVAMLRRFIVGLIDSL